MQLRFWFIGQSIVSLVNSLGVIFMTEFYLEQFGFTSLTDTATLMARLLGAALFGWCVLAWAARNSVASAAQSAILYGLTAANGVGFVIALLAQLDGIPNAMGWSIVALYLILALGFGYFSFKSRE